MHAFIALTKENNFFVVLFSDQYGRLLRQQPGAHCMYTKAANISSMRVVGMLCCKEEDYLGNGGQQLLGSFHILS